MQRNLIIIVTITIIAIIIGGAAVWAFTNPSQNANVQPTPTPTSTPTHTQEPQPEPLTQEQIRDTAIAYIQTNHAELAELIANLTWEGGRVETGLLGSEIYNYTSADWTITIQYPVVQYPVYTITANYTSGDATLMWEGTYEDGAITEIGYTPSNLIWLTQEQIRDIVMNHIQINHEETAQLMTDLNWTGKNITPEHIIGYTTYEYTSTNWVVQMGHPIIPHQYYEITANYTSDDVTVVWIGTYNDGAINETSYSQSNLIILTTQEQVRDDIMNYIKTTHSETAVYMQDLTWTGGAVDQGMLVGSSKYNYQSTGWNVTMQYPVVLNPVYTVTVNYSPLSQISPAQNIVTWTGTWQSGTITENSYNFTS